MARSWLGIAVLVALLALPSTSVAAVQARQADSFVDSIGVNVHTEFEDTPYYQRFDEVGEKLEALGVRHVRDVLVPDRSAQYDALAQLADAGMRSTLVLGRPDWGDSVLDELLPVLKDDLNGDVDAVEGPNEYSTSGDPEWKAHLVAYQEELYGDVKGDPALSALPVIGPSIVHGDQDELGDVSSFLDYGNIHSYPQGNPPDKLGSFITRAELNSGSKPIVATETGYNTALNWSGENPPVSEQAMATYMPRLFLEYFRWGMVRTFAYELLDEHSDPGEAEREDHFGLLRHDLSAKPAFTALSNTIHILEDPGPAFASGSLDYTLIDDGTEVSGPESTQLHKVLLQKRDGTFYLALWRLSSVWDPATKQPLAAPAKPVTVEVRPGIEAAAEYLPNSSAEPVWSVSRPSDPLTLDVGPTVVILAVKPGTESSTPTDPGTEGTDPETEDTNAVAPATEAEPPTGLPPLALQAPASPLRCQVPRLEGRTLRAARRRVAAAGCTLGKVRRVRGAAGKRGRVVGQKPKPGGSFVPHTEVQITLRRR